MHFGNSPTQQLTAGVYDALVDATAVGAFLKNPSDQSLQSAHDDALTRELHEEANINLNVFKKMVVNLADFAGVGGGAPPPPADPLVGTFFGWVGGCASSPRSCQLDVRGLTTLT